MVEVSDEEKRDFVTKRLQKDCAAADFQVSLVLAALGSYRFDSVLRPFPPMFLSGSEGTKNYKRLETVSEKLPPLKKTQVCNLESTELNLLYWMLKPKNFSLHSCKKEKYEAIRKLTGQSMDTPHPTHIFEVIMNPAAENKFTEMKSDRTSYYAYHGSRLENFHSILHNGLQSHMNKNSLFGEGTYLSAELSVSMPYAPTGKSWEKSVIGDRLSVIAVAEIIDDPSVKCQVKNSDSSRPVSRGRVANSMGGDVPEKYYIVQNNEMIRIKYLVVFAEASKNHRSLQTSVIYRHRFALTMLAYMFLLILVGLYNSKSFHYQIKKWLR